MLRRFLRLSRDRRWLAAAAAALQLIARVALTRARIDRLAACAGAAGRVLRVHCEPAEVEWALAVTKPVVGGTCLTQALAGCVLHGWSGRHSQLVIGVRGVRRGPDVGDVRGVQPGGGTPEFHAWTRGGQHGAPADAYATLVSWQ